MTNQSTIDKLIEMRLTAMADAFRIQMDDPTMKEVWQLANTLQNTGTSSLQVPPEVVKLIWPVLLAWRPANTTTQYGMCGFLIYYWTYRLPETAELFQLS